MGSPGAGLPNPGAGCSYSPDSQPRFAGAILPIAGAKVRRQTSRVRCHTPVSYCHTPVPDSLGPVPLISIPPHTSTPTAITHSSSQFPGQSIITNQDTP